MRITVLGGGGAWPTPSTACSGYLVVHQGYRLLIDPGYATLPQLMAVLPVEKLDAVLVSHGHPDHCADLNPMLRARALADDPPAPLPVYALPGAVDHVLALDRPRVWQHACEVHEFVPGKRFDIGPFTVDSWLLPHHVPNAGVRIGVGGKVLAFTGDTGPTPELVDLARDADLFLAEATFPEQVPVEDAAYLSTAAQAGEHAAAAGVGCLMLTHLWPGVDPARFEAAAHRSFDGLLRIAHPGSAFALL